MRVVLILIIPTGLIIELTESRFVIYWFCTLGGSYPSLLLEYMPITYFHPSYVLVPLTAMLPGLLFSLELGRRPLKKSVRRLTLWVLLATLAIHFLAPFLAMIGAMMGAQMYEIMYLLAQVFPIIIAVLIVLPLMLRETVISSCPDEFLSLSLREVEQIPNLGHLRNKTVTALLWSTLVFGPFIVYSSIDTYFAGSLDFVGVLYQIMYRSYSFGSLAYYLHLQIYPGIYVWLMLLMSSVRLLFVREIYRWFAGRSSNSRFIILGVLGELLPSGIISLSYLFTPGMEPTGIFLPFPCVLLFGLASLKLYKFALDTGSLWGQSHVLSSDMEEQRDGQRELADEIKVPLLYLVRSKIGSLSRKKKHCVDGEPDEMSD